MSGFLEIEGRTEEFSTIAPCGIVIRYVVDMETDAIIYDNIAERGRGNYSPRCEKCEWIGYCHPTEKQENCHTFSVRNIVMFDDEQMEVIRKAYMKAHGTEPESRQDLETFVNVLADISICERLYRLAKETVKGRK